MIPFTVCDVGFNQKATVQSFFSVCSAVNLFTDV